MDIWEPGEHNGTFRGNNLAFVTAALALKYWENYSDFEAKIRTKAGIISSCLANLVQDHPEIQGRLRGRGFMQGIACGIDGLADKICSVAFNRGLILETSGGKSEVIKLMPPLTIDEDGLALGLSILEDSITDIRVKSFITRAKRKSRPEKYPLGYSS